MAKIVLGELPKPLEVQLVHGDGASLVATLTDEAGAELAWPSAPTLEFSGAARTVVASHVASVVGPVATWSLGRAQVDAIWNATKALSQSTLVRAALPDGDDGLVEYAGAVVWSDGWTAGARTQTVSFTLPGGLPGVGVPAGGTTGQALVKNSGTDYDTEWADVAGGPGGAVSSVAGRTGAVVLASADVGLGNVTNTSDANKPVSTAQAAADSAVATAAATDATTKANAAQAAAIQRANHTGTQPSSTISDFTEAAQDAVAAMLASGANVSLNYNDAGNALTITATGTDAEAVRDTIGAALVGVGNVTVTVNDALDTITISTTATTNDTDANLRARSSHTGTQSADTLTDGTTNKAFLATERTKLTGIATGATANSSDATLLARANHTGSQAISTVAGLQTALDGLAPIRSTINAQTGTTYTPVLGDENKLVTLTNAGAITLTLPSDASVAIPVGGRVDFAVLGAGMATFVAGSGATIAVADSAVTRKTNSAASAIKVAANTWLVVGDLA